LHDWSAGIELDKLIGMNRPSTRRSSSNIWSFSSLAKSLWVTIRGQASKGDTAVGGLLQTSNQGEEVDLKQAPYCRPWFFWGNFPEISWKGRMAEHRQSRLLEGVRKNFLIQVLHGPPRGDAQVDVPFTSKEELEI